MGKSVRQLARARVLERQAAERAEREAIEKRQAAAVVNLVVAVAEREEAILRHERKAAQAFDELTTGAHALSVTEVLRLSDGQVTRADVQRFRALHDLQPESTGERYEPPSP